jgi:large subunit ribosomal protein L9
MASTASTLSWTSSSLLQSFTGNINQATKISDRGTALVIIAQKKAKKARTVMLANGFSFITWCFYLPFVW